jgi:hypothetical protein
MRKDGLGKLYDRLTPEERFRLVIEAEVRGDEEESGRLVRSAPRCTYTVAVPAYTSLVRSSHEVTWAVCLDLLPSLARMRMIAAFREALPLTYNRCIDEALSAYLDGDKAGSRRAWEAAGKTGEPPGWRECDEEEEDPEVEEALDSITGRIEVASERFTGLLKNLELGIAADARALWEAFSNFSRTELGLEPKKLVKFWYEAALPEIEELEALTEGLEIGREKLEESEALLKSGWSKLMSSSRG